MTVLFAEYLCDGDYCCYDSTYRYSVYNTSSAAYRHNMTANLVTLAGNALNFKPKDDIGNLPEYDSGKSPYVWGPNDSTNK